MRADTIITTHPGFQIVSHNGPTLEMCWSDVHTVSFSKIDAITSVITYLTFDYHYGKYIETHDQMTGFSHLLADLPQHLSITQSHWQEAMQAAVPEDKPVTIYQRPCP